MFRAQRLMWPLVTMVIAAVPPFVGVAGATSAGGALSCRPQQMTVTVHTDSTKPPKTDTVWFGRVVYKNTGERCQLASSTVTVLAETGSSSSPRALTKRYLLLAIGSPFTVRNGGSAHTWLQVRDVPPKSWVQGQECPPKAMTGLKVGGPSKAWPLRYFALRPAVAYCFTYTIKANSGSLAPGP